MFSGSGNKNSVVPTVKDTTILVVEDDGLITLSLMQILQKSGFDVPDPLASGEEALEYLGKYPYPDLILMDISLNGKLDGIETARQIRQTSGIPIIFISAHSDDNRRTRAGEVTLSGFIVKPFTDKEVLSVYRIVAAPVIPKILFFLKN